MKICMGNSFQNRLAMPCLPDVRVYHRKRQFKYTSKPVSANRAANVRQLYALGIYFMSVFVLFSITLFCLNFVLFSCPVNSGVIHKCIEKQLNMLKSMLAKL